ncbi:DUF983 domain-containing protein [Shinella daejeonensis]|uniref:DUF983 domain-containing protein n=1 Tax=Shinella daejeonensis TaxID=659017 RepID=UPI0020C7D8FB|nr:DUF983 domain-containing protein [Shinella daejeonensis]MCP8895559.1 DUF983 domain-containing protein [Shinella daejeonensis]
MQTNDVSADALQFGSEDAPIRNERPVGRAIKRGLLNRCPACGTGRLFRAYVKSVHHCAACGEDYTHQRADDLPPYLVITLVGHVVVAAYMATDLTWSLSTWQHLAIWVPITLILSLLMLQPVKGGVIGLQWAMRMHGFDQRPENASENAALNDSAA